MWYGISITVGLLLLAVGLYQFSRSMDFIKTGTRVIGTVAALEPRRGKKGKFTYRPIFHYKVNGEKRSYTYPVASNPAAWKVGEETSLVIVPGGDPKKVMVLTYFGAFGWSVVTLALAFPLLIIGTGYLWANNFIQKLSSASW